MNQKGWIIRREGKGRMQYLDVMGNDGDISEIQSGINFVHDIQRGRLIVVEGKDLPGREGRREECVCVCVCVCTHCRLGGPLIPVQLHPPKQGSSVSSPLQKGWRCSSNSSWEDEHCQFRQERNHQWSSNRVNNLPQQTAVMTAGQGREFSPVAGNSFHVHTDTQ